MGRGTVRTDKYAQASGNMKTGLCTLTVWVKQDLLLPGSAAPGVCCSRGLLPGSAAPGVCCSRGLLLLGSPPGVCYSWGLMHLGSAAPGVSFSRGLLLPGSAASRRQGEAESVSARVNWVLPCVAARQGARLSSPALYIIDHRNNKYVARGVSVRLGRIVRLGPSP